MLNLRNTAPVLDPTGQCLRIIFFNWPYNAHSAEVDGQTPRKSASRKRAAAECFSL